MNFLTTIGEYALLIGRLFSKPEKFKVYWKQFIYELDKIGSQSLGIVALLSIFMGGVITLQTASNIDSALIPTYTIGFASRQSVILEFSPTLISLILAGKVGSNIASEIGTMRITEQIDALDIMGVNSASYLILPKVIAALFIFPFLIIISMFLGITAGGIFGSAAGLITLTDYVDGVQFDFRMFSIIYALIKTLFFAFIIVTISSYFGYNTKGGALQVGESSTKAVVFSSVYILITNYFLTQLLLL
ncbi:MAG: MlaE family ABC transporter permease [Flavobacteriales bacterium]